MIAVGNPHRCFNLVVHQSVMAAMSSSCDKWISTKRSRPLTSHTPHTLADRKRRVPRKSHALAFPWLPAALPVAQACVADVGEFFDIDGHGTTS